MPLLSFNLHPTKPMASVLLQEPCYHDDSYHDNVDDDRLSLAAVDGSCPGQRRC